MKKIAGLFCLLLVNSVVYATDPPQNFMLDTVNFEVAAKQWVSTQTALLTVNINASLSNADLVKTRADMMDSLGKIATGEWHITQFDRSQDNSGLEKLYVQAQARVVQSALTKVYQNAKSVSKPGATYGISSVEFKPSIDEVQQARVQLRERLYGQARDEMARINKLYAGQNYSLYNLTFIEGDAVPPPQILREKGAMNAMVMPAAAPALTVSNELTMTAIVQVASNRQQGAN